MNRIGEGGIAILLAVAIAIACAVFWFISKASKMLWLKDVTDRIDKLETKTDALQTNDNRQDARIAENEKDIKWFLKEEYNKNS